MRAVCSTVISTFLGATKDFSPHVASIEWKTIKFNLETVLREVLCMFIALWVGSDLVHAASDALPTVNVRASATAETDAPVTGHLTAPCYVMRHSLF